MGRWTQYDEDLHRLPDNLVRIGYDADTGVYTFRDANGALFESAPGQKYGALKPISLPRTADQEDSEESESEFEFDADPVPTYKQSASPNSLSPSAISPLLSEANADYDRPPTSFHDVLDPSHIHTLSDRTSKGLLSARYTGRRATSANTSSAPSTSAGHMAEHSESQLTITQNEGSNSIAKVVRRATMPTRRMKEVVQSVVRRSGTLRGKSDAVKSKAAEPALKNDTSVPLITPTLPIAEAARHVALEHHDRQDKSVGRRNELDAPPSLPDVPDTELQDLITMSLNAMERESCELAS